MNIAAILLFALSAVSLALGVGFGVAVGEDTGTALLIGAGLAGAIGGLALVGTQGRDLTSRAAGREPLSLPAAGSSVWPLGFGLAAVLIATGMAAGSGLVLLGLAAAAVAGAGWFAQSWASHPTWTDEQHERVSSRLVMPLVLPLGVTALVLTVAFAFSRTLLAVSKNAAIWIALVAALVILGAGVLVALRGLGRSAVLGLLTAGVLATAGLGVGGAVAGEREFHDVVEERGHAGETSESHAEEGAEEGGSEPGQEAGEHGEGEQAPPTTGQGAAAAAGEPEASTSSRIELSADNLEFDKDELTLPAGEVATIVFANEESQPHNVAIRNDGGSTVWRPEGGGIITGPGEEIEYEVSPIEPGEYRFFCEVHPAQMVGDLTVA